MVCQHHVLHFLVVVDIVNVDCLMNSQHGKGLTDAGTARTTPFVAGGQGRWWWL
jgi:hypothetical protein